VVFHPLGIEEIERIVDLQFEKIRKRICEQGVQIELEPEARSFLAKEGYDPGFGARPLKRAIQKLITNPIANRLLAWDIQKGARIVVRVKENYLDFSVEND